MKKCLSCLFFLSVLSIFSSCETDETNTTPILVHVDSIAIINYPAGSTWDIGITVENNHPDPFFRISTEYGDIVYESTSELNSTGETLNFDNVDILLNPFDQYLFSLWDEDLLDNESMGSFYFSPYSSANGAVESLTINAATISIQLNNLTYTY